MSHALLRQAAGRPVAILQEKLDEITGLLYRHHHGQQLDATAIAVGINKEKPPLRAHLVDAHSGERMPLAAERDGKTPARYIAVLPLFGTLVQHAGIMTDYSGGTSLSKWARKFQALDADASIGWIVIETHSPGGAIYFVEETANMIHAARERGQTKIIQVANSAAASAAVWIGSQANEVVVTTGGEYGSIGVISQYVDESAWLEQQGVKNTFVRTPPNKARFTGVEPLTEEMLATMTERNEASYKRFVAAVARGRGVSASKVKTDFGGGEMLSAAEAKAAGLVDRVATMQEVLDDLVSAKRKAAAGVRYAAAVNRLKLAETE